MEIRGKEHPAKDVETLAGQREARAGLGASGTHTRESARQLVTSRGSRQQLAAPTGPLRKGETPVSGKSPGNALFFPLLPPPPRRDSVCPKVPSAAARGATLSALRSSSSPPGSSRAPRGSYLILSPGFLCNPSGSGLIFPSWGHSSACQNPLPKLLPSSSLSSLLFSPLPLGTPISHWSSAPQQGCPDSSIEPSLPTGSFILPWLP